MILAAYNTVPFSQGLRRSTDALFAKGAKPSEGVVVGPWSAVKVAGKHGGRPEQQMEIPNRKLTGRGVPPLKSDLLLIAGSDKQPNSYARQKH